MEEGAVLNEVTFLFNAHILKVGVFLNSVLLSDFLVAGVSQKAVYQLRQLYW